MLGRLNHVAIAVKDAEKAAKIYGGAFGAEISGAVPLPEHGVITVFVTLPNTKIEFIQPLGEASPIAKFVERNADGGIHHVCYDVPDIIAARDRMIAEGEELDEIVFDMVVSTIEGLPRARRRDPDAMAESVRRAVRAVINEHWGKKPICLVHVLTV